MKKIFLVNVYYPESGYGEKLNFPPVGLGYISEFLDLKGVDHEIIDMGIGTTIEEIFGRVRRDHPAFIGFSINSLQLKKTREIMKSVKRESPETMIVVGGPHVTTQGVKVFADLPEVDFGIVGEGEESFYDLVSGKPSTGIAGLVYKENGVPKENERRITENIDTIPFPKFKRFKLQEYRQKTIPLLSSRGCPFRCIFCQQSSLLSKSWRGVSADYFIEAVKYWKSQGYREIQVLDDNFAFDVPRLKRLADLYEKEGISDVRLILVGGIRIASATEELLLLLKRLGVDYLSFGVEAFDDEVLKFIKKGTTVAQIEERVKLSTEMGFRVRLFFIIGFPHQTVEQLRRTYKFVLKYPVYQVRFFNLIPYENTYLKEWLDEHGTFIHLPEVYMNDFKSYQEIPVFEAEFTMSPAERAAELKVADRFAKLVSERAKFWFDDLG
jgi:anaerobic magnesium-protoporphyrin IX monomethyl ester cyclase